MGLKPILSQHGAFINSELSDLNLYLNNCSNTLTFVAIKFILNLRIN